MLKGINEISRNSDHYFKSLGKFKPADYCINIAAQFEINIYINRHNGGTTARLYIVDYVNDERYTKTFSYAGGSVIADVFMFVWQVLGKIPKTARKNETNPINHYFIGGNFYKIPKNQLKAFK